MDSHPKVMTVSYGTFSCTLNGFDDPFTTMQLVAEYFRKLAAEDRYFGGEPLQPDANILHRIASDANPYKVDAEVTDTGVTLSKARVVEAQEKAEAEAARARREAAAAARASAEPEPQVEAEEVASPLFRSHRTPPPVVEDVEDDTPPAPSPPPAAARDAGDDATLVEAAMFSSRRNGLTGGPEEPSRPAAAVLAEEDEEDDFEDAPQGQPTAARSAVAAKQALGALPKRSAGQETARRAPAPAAEPAQFRAHAPEQRQQNRARHAPEQPAARISERPSDRPAGHFGSASTKDDSDIQREEEALERLLETTNSKLETPENARRSNALERLKAAVAATEAERRLRANATARSDATDRGSDTARTPHVSPEEFRQKMADRRKDHEEVVSFTRPTVKARTQRPRGGAATLILGADQRVVSGAEGAADPSAKKPGDEAEAGSASRDRITPPLKIVRPTPRSTRSRDTGAQDAADNIFRDDAPETAPEAETEFAAFADRLGATSLHELLEASAAYLSIIEQEPRFSQQRILANLSAYLAENSVSDDVTLRSLNQLMRDGRLLRVKADSYTLSKSARSGYKDRLVG